ncbi:hypothetical protein TNCV_3355351 [Trichonephila clavipes]|nr:hypothetical protein TNCV_3355351 [Trichonephila clavipes]
MSLLPDDIRADELTYQGSIFPRDPEMKNGVRGIPGTKRANGTQGIVAFLEGNCKIFDNGLSAAPSENQVRDERRGDSQEFLVDCNRAEMHRNCLDNSVIQALICVL